MRFRLLQFRLRRLLFCSRTVSRNLILIVDSYVYTFSLLTLRFLGSNILLLGSFAVSFE